MRVRRLRAYRSVIPLRAKNRIMKNALKLIGLTVIFLYGCGKPSQESINTQDSLKLESKALYGQAMDIHDEIMPKMDKLYTLRKSLKDTLANTPTLAPAVKTDIEARIHLLDSADKSMMDWMHDSRLRPSKDTTNHEVYQRYMKSKVESAEKMKALMLEAIERGKL